MNKEIKLLDYQNILSIIFIITIIISILLTYDEKLKLLNKKLFDDKTAENLCIIALLIIYINVIDYKIGQEKGSNLNPLRHQVEASIFNAISALIVLYTVYENRNFNITSIENPTI